MKAHSLALALGLLSLSGCGKKESKASTVSACTPSAPGDVKSLRIGWRAHKNAAKVPVDGSISGQGIIELANGNSLGGALLEFDFDPNSVNSGIVLRDERIMNIFLQSTSFGHASLKAIINTPESALPANGVTIPVTVDGILNLVGQEIPVNINAEVVGVGQSVYLRQRTNEVVSFSILHTDYLKMNASNLIRTALVKSMDENLEVWGTFPIQETCGQ